MKYSTFKSLKVFLHLFFLFLVINIQAQVTIGLNEAPVEGALLQLKEIENINDGSANSTRGMMLPRVNLVGVWDAKIGATTDFTQESDYHTGLFVYNLFDNTAIETDEDKLLCVGPYVWDGLKWVRLWEACRFTYGGKVDCENNISEITIGTCLPLNRLGSFRLSAYDNTVIRINNGDILGQKDGYVITAQKTNLGGGDVDYYEVTQDNSPVDINVVITGPISTTAKTVTIPIDLSSKIIAGNARIEGCPYSVVNVTENSMITTPSAIIFTSGLDGLSLGYQAVVDAGGNFGGYPIGNIDAFITSQFLVRPWGIKDIPFESKLPAPSRSGMVKDDNRFWPFTVNWSPSSATVKVMNTTDVNTQPKFDLIKDGQDLPSNGSPNSCGYITYSSAEAQVGTNPVWHDFIKMYPMDEAPLFTKGGGSKEFLIDEPHTLSKKIHLVHSEGITANFDIRQIHYGTQILDMNGIPYSQSSDDGHIKVYNFNPTQHNNEFKFKINSNAKWKCTQLYAKAYSKSGSIDETYLVSATNLATTGAMAFGPEEDAYGNPRERTVTLKFNQSTVIPDEGYVQITIYLMDSKLITTSTAGRVVLTIQLYNKANP
ncbi:MAG: hypothetical protein E6767_12775 [Dysgonomonas sp.]|nr:hypothetical protein [Dysgonomonas sp.]